MKDVKPFLGIFCLFSINWISLAARSIFLAMGCAHHLVKQKPLHRPTLDSLIVNGQSEVVARL